MGDAVRSESFILLECTALAFIPRISSAQDLWFRRLITLSVILINERISLGGSIFTWNRVILALQMILIDKQELPFLSSASSFICTFTGFGSLFSIIGHLLDDLVNNLFLGALPTRLTPQIIITWLLRVPLEIVWINNLAFISDLLLWQSWGVNGPNLWILELVHVNCRGWSQNLLARVVKNCLRVSNCRLIVVVKRWLRLSLVLDYHRRLQLLILDARTILVARLVLFQRHWVSGAENLSVCIIITVPQLFSLSGFVSEVSLFFKKIEVFFAQRRYVWFNAHPAGIVPISSMRPVLIIMQIHIHVSAFSIFLHLVDYLLRNFPRNLLLILDQHLFENFSTFVS